MDTNKELTHDEIDELRRWQKRMISVVVLTMIVLAVLVFGEFLLDFTATLELAIVLGLVALTGVGVWIQFTRHCPNCGYRLGFQSRLLVPEACRKCGVRLRSRDRQ